MNTFTNEKGIAIVHNLIKVIQDNKQYLSDIDGLIGDGDHGINMNKGFTICAAELEKQSGNLSYGMTALSKILTEKELKYSKLMLAIISLHSKWQVQL